jgi:predicted ABC-type ATPase
LSENELFYPCAERIGLTRLTLDYDLVPDNTPIINSDEIAKKVRNAGIFSINILEYTSQEAIRLVDEQRKLCNSFAIEIILSYLDSWKLIASLKRFLNFSLVAICAIL